MIILERIIMKLAIIQLLCLITAQVILHSLNWIPEIKEISRYEGVTDNNHTELLDVFKGRN